MSDGTARRIRRVTVVMGWWSKNRGGANCGQRAQYCLGSRPNAGYSSGAALVRRKWLDYPVPVFERVFRRELTDPSTTLGAAFYAVPFLAAAFVLARLLRSALSRKCICPAEMRAPSSKA